MWTLVRQWRRKRVLMRPEAAFPYVFAAEGAQHPSNKPPRSPALAASPATLNGPRRSIPTLTGPRRIILTLNAAQRPCAVIAKK